MMINDRSAPSAAVIPELVHDDVAERPTGPARGVDAPSFAPDGSIVFARGAKAPSGRGIYTRRIDGRGSSEAPTKRRRPSCLAGWSPDRLHVDA
jgi:hypothetical protein